LAREREAELKRLRGIAVPITADHFEEGAPMSLRAAGERVLSSGGKLEVSKDGRLVVSLPPNVIAGRTDALEPFGPDDARLHLRPGAPRNLAVLPPLQRSKQRGGRYKRTEVMRQRRRLRLVGIKLSLR
jgi:hypothetical protein